MPEILDYADGAEGNQATPPNGLPRFTLGGLVYDTIREIMARTKRFALDTGGASVATGSLGNYSVATSAAMVLRPGAALKWRTNHVNPNAGPTLNVNGTGSRPLTYADGSTIPASALGSRQLVSCAWDNDNGRWNTTIMPASQYVGAVTGDKLSLTGQTVGAVAIYTSGGWIASAAGAVGQFLQGGSSPSFVTPTNLSGTVLLACVINAGTTVSVRTGLPHTATVSKTGTGRYRLNVTPALPSSYVPSCSVIGSGGGGRIATISTYTTTAIDLFFQRISDDAFADLSGDSKISVVAV